MLCIFSQCPMSLQKRPTTNILDVYIISAMICVIRKVTILQLHHPQYILSFASQTICGHFDEEMRTTFGDAWPPFSPWLVLVSCSSNCSFMGGMLMTGSESIGNKHSQCNITYHIDPLIWGELRIYFYLMTGLHFYKSKANLRDLIASAGLMILKLDRWPRTSRNENAYLLSIPPLSPHPHISGYCTGITVIDLAGQNNSLAC